MNLVDSHCHIQSIDSLEGEETTKALWHKSGLRADEVIKSAIKSQVTKFICVGCDLSDSRLAISFASQRDNCYVTIGIHPHEAQKYVNNQAKQTEFANLLTDIGQNKIVGIGECGLDYFYQHSNRQDQAAILRFQLDLAVQYELPIVFHIRDAFQDFWPIFDSYQTKLKGVIHSFTDSKATLMAALDRGLYIGVNGIATFAKQPAQQAMYNAIPINRLLLETDSPYLTPTPYRGNINEPKHIMTIAEFLANQRGESLKVLAETTTINSHLLFGI